MPRSKYNTTNMMIPSCSVQLYFALFYLNDSNNGMHFPET